MDGMETEMILCSPSWQGLPWGLACLFQIFLLEAASQQISATPPPFLFWDNLKQCPELQRGVDGWGPESRREVSFWL